jgi:hypothetical protein
VHCKSCSQGDVAVASNLAPKKRCLFDLLVQYS